MAKRPAVVAIPALEPAEALVALVGELERARVDVIVVDDGSGSGSRAVFDRCALAGAVVVHLARNGGKGRALRVAFETAAQSFPGAGVVTADADGQHTPGDILAVRAVLDAAGGRTFTGAPGMRARPRPLVLGVRSFGAETPLRSRFGNAVSSLAFRVASGAALGDTQTGLRGLPAEHLAWARSLPGDRYEYEYAMLVRAVRDGIGLVHVPIETVYEDDNAGSHFRPVRDSLRVLGPVLTFAASGSVAAVLDTGLFWLLTVLGLPIPAALAGARAVSAVVNFSSNRWWVFRGGRRVPLARAAARYAMLALGILLAGTVLVDVLAGLGVPVLIAKVSADLLLFCGSFAVQRLVVFRRPRGGRDGSDEAAPTVGPGAYADDRTAGTQEVEAARARV